MGFQLDTVSIQRLVGVHPDLVKVVRDCAANGTLPFKFGVSEGLRTLAQQELDVARGFSQTMKSRHLDGHAVDLAPLRTNPQGQTVMSWAWPPFYVLASQMRAASIRMSVPVVWGGVWDMELASIIGDMEAASDGYVARARAKGERGFLDGPHFQLPLSIQYPAGPPIA